MKEIVKKIPDIPNIILKGIPTELEQVANQGLPNENGNLIQQIVRDFSEPLDLIPLDDSGSYRDVFSIDELIEKKNRDRTRYIHNLYYPSSQNFDYAFENIVCSSIRHLIFHGKAYLAIILTLNQEDEVTHVEFLPLYAQIKKKGKGKIEFISISWDDKMLDFTVESRFLVSVSLADMGIHEELFISAFEKIRDIPLITEQIEPVLHPKPWYNFNNTVREREMEILKATKDFYYAGPGVSNSKLMSDFHLIYRICQFKMLKRKVFDHIVEQINKQLTALEDEYHFPGQIIINFPPVDYMSYYEKLEHGEITLKQMFDIFQYGKLIGEYKK